MTQVALVAGFRDLASGLTTWTLVLPGGTAYRKAHVARPRWHRSAHPVHPGTSIDMFHAQPADVHGAAFMEVDDDEARAMVQRPGAVPRSANARFEKVRAAIGADKSNSWPELQVLTQWGAAMDVPIHPSGRLKAVPVPVPAAAAVEGAAEPDGPAMRTDYPNIVSGSVPLATGGTYLIRKIGRRSDVSVLRSYREQGKHVLTYGQSGVGKTFLTQAAYEHLMMTVLCTEDTVAADFIGEYVNIPGQGWTWVDGPLPICMEEGLPLYVDEIARARQKQLAVLFSAMDARQEISITMGRGRPRVVRARPGFAVAASANLSASNGDLDDALRSRFQLKLEVTTDYDMARSQLSIDPALVNAAENLEVRRRARETSWAVQMRDLVITQQNIEQIGMPAALGSLVNSAPIRDRDTIADVLSKAMGRSVAALVLS
jgi:nitric oxide reductase NorQ protein